MMRFVFLLVFFMLITLVSKTEAYYNPLERNNNFIGVHILFPDELDKASQFVNSNGGEWGYVTIPIQIGDRDIEKWQKFMDNAREKKIIPLVRLATEVDYKNTSSWRIPNEYDLLDFANFLNSLHWPTENKYVIFFNEMNRSDEWGGQPPNPEEYARILNYGIDVFKARSGDFFVIMGGLDAAAPNDGVQYMNSFVYLERMALSNPALFNRLDGFSSHSYPNPNFADAPNESKRVSVATYRYEYDFINSKASRKIPVFITETGWNNEAVAEETISRYYQKTLQDIWGKDKDKIVAITPFLLESQNGSFDKFSFFKNGQPKPYYKAVENYAKPKGEPKVLTATPSPKPVRKVLGVKSFEQKISIINPKPIPEPLKFYLKALFYVH